MEKKSIDSRPESLFKNPVLEKLARTSSMTVITVYLLLSIAITIYGSFTIESTTLQKVLFFICGLALYSLIEYVFHRFLYHSGHNYKDEKSWQYKIHGVHHTHPREKDILAMPLILGLILGALFFIVFYTVIGDQTFFFWPGFMIGYATYLLVHFKVHTSRPPNNALRYLWIHHHLHHHVDDQVAFGVSSPLWDYIFNTMPKNRKLSNKEMNH